MKNPRRVKNPTKIVNEEVHICDLHSTLDDLQVRLTKAEGVARDSRDRSQTLVKEAAAVSGVALVLALLFKRPGSA